MDVDDAIDDALNAGAETRAFDSSQLPAYPSTKLFPAIAIPMMPRFSGDDLGDARLMIKAFKAACFHRYGKKPRVDKQAMFRMKAALFQMRRLGVKTPYSWAMFRLGQWQFSARKAKPPGIDYVYSRAVVETHFDQYRGVAESFDVISKVALAPSHTELIARWEETRRAVASPKHPPGREVTRRVVDSILPTSEYRRLADSIAPEKGDAEAELFRRLASGDWIW